MHSEADLVSLRVSFQSILLYTIFSHKPVTYGLYEYPGWAIGIGWIMAGFGIIPLPFFAIFEMVRTKGTFKEVRRCYKSIIFNFAKENGTWTFRFNFCLLNNNM